MNFADRTLSAPFLEKGGRSANRSNVALQYITRGAPALSLRTSRPLGDRHLPVHYKTNQYLIP